MNMPKNLGETIPDDILSYLRDLGLSYKESLVYYSLLKTGEAGTSLISKASGLHSQFVYNSLDVLLKKGLVEKYMNRQRARYSARDPKVFYEQLEKSKNTINLLTASVESNLITTLDSKSVQIYKGKEAFVNNEMLMIKEAPAKTEILIIGGPGDEYISQFGNQFNQYEYIRNKKGLKLRYIGNESQKKYLEESLGGRSSFDFKYLPGKYNGVMNISICKNFSVTIYLFQNPISTIVIKNQKIIESYAEFFEALWGVSKK